MKCTSLLLGLGLLVCTLVRSTSADVVFTEDFTLSSANWANFNSSAPLSYVATGGPDGGAYASGPRNFNNLFPGGTTIFHRARPDFPWFSSGNNFARDYLEEDITDISLYVRHNYTEAPLTYISRIASTANTNGHVYQADGPPVPANQWTKINFDISRFSPNLLSDEGSTYYQNMHDVGFVTFGVFVPGGLPTNPNGSINHNFAFTFDIDKVTIISPEPTTAVMGGAGLLGLLFYFPRRRHS